MKGDFSQFGAVEALSSTTLCCVVCQPNASCSLPAYCVYALLQGAAPFSEASAKQLVSKVLLGTAVTLPLPVSGRAHRAVTAPASEAAAKASSLVSRSVIGFGLWASRV